MKEGKWQVALGTSAGWRKGKERLEKQAEQLLNICSLPGTMYQGLGWLKWSDNDHKDSWSLIWPQILFNRQRRTTDSASSWTSYQISYIDLHTAVRIFFFCCCCEVSISKNLLKRKKKKRNLLKMYMRSYLSCKIFPHFGEEKPCDL